MPAAQNGSKKWLWGVGAALAIAAVGTGAGMVIGHGSRLAVVEEKINHAINPERMVKLETEVEGMKEDITEIKGDGKTTNSKLDALLGRFNVRLPD